MTHDRKAGLEVPLPGLFDIVDAVVAPPAEVEAQRPVGRHEGPPHQCRVLLDYGLGRRPHEHKKVHDPARAPQGDGRTGLQHDVCRSKKHSTAPIHQYAAVTS